MQTDRLRVLHQAADRRAAGMNREYRDRLWLFYQFLPPDSDLYLRLFGDCSRANTDTAYRSASEIPLGKCLRVLQSLEQWNTAPQSQHSLFVHSQSGRYSV